jgi:cation diffusion facilitator CzcD-associated flavoprotein CzcO
MAPAVDTVKHQTNGVFHPDLAKSTGSTVETIEVISSPSSDSGSNVLDLPNVHDSAVRIVDPVAGKGVEPLNDGLYKAGTREETEADKLRDMETAAQLEITEDVDMLIIGAGISGINMAYRTKTMLKNKSYVILERRESMGGTWDIMRYPGIRSDSDLYTFGFAWKPWPFDTPIAEGGLIVKYMKECAASEGIDKHIRYRHKVLEGRWQTREQAWTVKAEAIAEDGTKSVKYYRGKFLVLGTGYYDYDTPLQTVIPGIQDFKGKVVHPQFWPENMDYTDKKVAVIGSGATAITIIPAMAEKAAKVTMVQRSPGYIISIPNRRAPKAWWERILPAWLQHRIIRLRYLLMGFIYRRFLSGDSDQTKKFLQRVTQAQLPAHIPYDPHFKPSYAPWTQRMCLCPDGDFFKALHTKKADVATGTIDTIEADGIKMHDGQKIEADIIVTATGLRMRYGGNADYFVDGERIVWGQKYLWRGVMIQDMPNAAVVQGYTKASWTLGADATAHMVVRMVKHLDSYKCSSAVPRVTKDDAIKFTRATGVMGLTSTYIMTALHRLPKSSDFGPWKPRGNYAKDIWDAKYSNIKQGIQFTADTS